MMPTTRMTGPVGHVRGNVTVNTTGSNVSQRNENLKFPNSPSQPTSIKLIPDSTVSFQDDRSAYFRTHYDLMTGVRIAATLGGFFLIVLLTLLYKSKCKKSSHLPTPIVISMDRINEALIIHPDPVEFCADAQGPHSLVIDGVARSSPWAHPLLRLTTPLEPESSSESDVGSPPITSTRLTLDLPRRDKSHTSPLQPIDIHIIQATPSISPSHSDLIPTKVVKSSNSPGDSDPETLSPLLLFLHAENFKYADDSSSENLPTEEIESPSLGSDSVFTFGHDRRPSFISVYTGLEEDEENCALCLTLATASVHPRDSFSDVESDYLEGRQRRSSSTQTTIADIRLSLNTRGDTPYLSVHHLSPTAPVRMASPTESLCGKGLKQAFRLHGAESNSITLNM